MTSKIRLISPWHTEINAGDFQFSTSFAPEETGALLCEWSPHQELLSFQRRKAWYCCEATSRGLPQTPEWQAFRKSLKPSEFLYHAHPDLRYRVPHITHVTTHLVNCSDQRLDRAVAIISNAGGSPWTRGRDLSLRARFATHPDVDLYGQNEAWSNFRRTSFSRPRLPGNYKGEIEGRWHDAARFKCMSQYKAAICFENTREAYYFTEKFACAVQSGCIPIYHAHKTLKEGILKKAAWVDPATFDYDVDATIHFALNENMEKYWTINEEWFKSEPVRATSLTVVFETIGQILHQESQKGQV